MTKYFKITILCSVFVLFSCKKDTEKVWDIEIKNPTKKVKIIDISKEFYNEALPLEDFKRQFPWFQGTVSDEDFALRRKDQEEKKIYHEAISKIHLEQLNTDLGQLFSRIQYYFPDFQEPTIYLYSSALQSVTDPIFYRPEEHMLFLDISAFMGDGNAHYKGLELYYQKTMNMENMVPKISLTLTENFVKYSTENQKFIDHMGYQGKLMILQEAFLPKKPNHLKINLSKEQYDWCQLHEANIWNYFVENDLIFSDDARLVERFIAVGPFSKFYTEIDNESSPMVGIFTGWQICKAFFKENPDTELKNFLNTDAETIFRISKYSPKL